MKLAVFFSVVLFVAVVLVMHQREGHYRGEWRRYRREHGRRAPWWWQ